MHLLLSFFRKNNAVPISSRDPFLPDRIRSGVPSFPRGDGLFCVPVTLHSGGHFLLPTRVAYSSRVARYARSCSSLLWLHRSAQTILNRLCLSNPEGTAFGRASDFFNYRLRGEPLHLIPHNLQDRQNRLTLFF